jgi:HSP20 family protein
MADRKSETPRRAIRPASYCIEDEGRILLMLDMPGVAKDALEIQVEDNELTITGRRPQRRIDGTWLVRERVEGDFVASYTVDDTIDPQKIEAALEGGVLTVTLNVKEAVKPRRIPVKSV